MGFHACGHRENGHTLAGVEICTGLEHIIMVMAQTLPSTLLEITLNHANEDLIRHHTPPNNGMYSPLYSGGFLKMTKYKILLIKKLLLKIG
jgi:hypothetical protein